MANLIRVRLMQMPQARDLEYLALRYLTLDGIYDVPALMANDLFQSGCATLVDGSTPLTEFANGLQEDAGDDVP